MISKELIANPNSIELNLEHILPQNASSIWLAEFPKHDKTQYVYRLDNMTLLDSSINRKLGNTSFQEKCSVAFALPKLEITKEILNYSVWGPKQIEPTFRTFTVTIGFCGILGTRLVTFYTQKWKIGLVIASLISPKLPKFVV